ncbi:signal transduction histidine kinase [Pullulanibacillus pueri]|uniref:histidine kinase n=1 Tax=Pullulanibacillus pueri TaxID=1437324 RepID=A0A8J2ZTR9_9BACL|nr:HAMP domain-containing sensor histidine kinase [Pullulanibacillus pueri]MBM7681310.1 signal transduction histidine kinase [Pullulanibacillus pueri]GGH77643.1 two-component sensor histidine kinase [Pullulanibacillus pueri]
MKKFWNILKHVLGALGIIGALLLCWSLAFLVDHWVFNRIAWSPPLFIHQLMISTFGFIIFGFIMFCVSRITRIQERQKKLFGSIIDAMENIAQGNFNIDLTYQFPGQNERHPFNHIVKTVKHMAEELGEMEHMRQEFISNVSHEIQSPLTSISGFAQALQSDHLSDQERKHYLEIIETESKRLSQMSENLLKLTSLEGEHAPFEPKAYRLDQQLRSVVLTCEPQWLNKKIDMEVNLEKVMITGDEALLNQVWINLIHNSIKFTPEHGKIYVSIEQTEEEVAVKIADTGVGMTKETQARIFERFYKADKSRNRSVGGNGLGLSIVKKIIEMHHGDIQVESRPNEGTQFTVSLAKKTLDN